MVARHADKLPEHRAVLQQGLARTSREVARGALLRTSQWQRVREFLTTRDLLVTPTSATPPFPIDQPVEINGHPVGRMLQRSYLTYAFSVLGLPAISIPVRLHQAGAPGRPADRGASPRRGGGAARGGGLRGGAALGGPHPAGGSTIVLTSTRGGPEPAD